MFSNLVSFINHSLASISYTPKVEAKSDNPFAENNSNPFVGFSGKNTNYAKNKPVAGGYFAGYINGVPNIVGRRLFVEA